MKCTFYRPEKAAISEFSAIIQKLRSDLDELETGTIPEKEVRRYLEVLLSYAKPLDNNPELYFFGLDDPQNMPSYARVDFFYWPTYVASTLIMSAYRIYPSILKRIDGAEDKLRACLRGCCGRQFHGSGYDDLQGLVEAMEFFTAHEVSRFLDLAGKEFCPLFSETFSNALTSLSDTLAKGSVKGTWGDDYTERTRWIIEKNSLSSVVSPYRSLRLYAAYGSNLNTEQMKHRCPDSFLVGTAELQNWRLLFKGSKSGNYLTIEPAAGYSVPLAIWAISDSDEASLDRYEGFPAYYYKKELRLSLRNDLKEEIHALIYVMHEDRKTGLPSQSYVERCLKGYRVFGFDPQLISEAATFSST